MIAVVVLTYRAPAGMLEQCVDAVVSAGGADLVVVVDNGGDVARVDRGAVHRDVTLLRADDNLGYAGGMNAGIAHCLGEGASAVALLNDDTVVQSGWLAALVRRLDDPAIGAVQPKLLLGGRAAGPAGPPRIQSVGVRVRDDGAGIDIGYGEVDRGQYDGVGTIDVFSGGAVMLGAPFLRAVGGFDERYFLYYEDVDLARRGHEAGWTYLVDPGVVVHHDMSATSTSVPDQRRYWQERNRLWCLFRHGTWQQIGRGLVLSLGRLAKHPGRPQARAIVDGLAMARVLRRERRHGVIAVSPFGDDRRTRWTVV